MIRLLFMLFMASMSLFSFADNVSFEEWLEGIRQQATEKGIQTSTLKVLDGLAPDPRVLKFDRAQPEFVQTFEEYLTARVTQYRIDTARKHFQENRNKLEEIAGAYSVDAQYLIAFWALESNFGRYQGKYSIVRSLATLGHDPRRSGFFTRELFNALQILDEGHVPAEEFVGGWAGAMGQNQFMPSSFLRYAQDYDGDSKKNIWSNRHDVWASIAYYLKQHGWKREQKWGGAVKLTDEIEFDSLRPQKVRKGCRAYRHHTRVLSIAEWKKLGVQTERLAEADEYAMVIPDAGESSAYLVGPNFSKILAYNCANKYAVSVGLLADEIVRQVGR